MAILTILILLVICIIPVAIAAVIISAINKKNKPNSGNFETSIRNIYSYIVLIITLFAIVIGTIITFRIGLDILLPEESTNNYTSSYNNDKIDRNENIVEVLTTMSLVITCIPIFIYHNKLTKELRELKNSENNIKN